LICSCGLKRQINLIIEFKQILIWNFVWEPQKESGFHFFVKKIIKNVKNVLKYQQTYKGVKDSLWTAN